MRGVYTAEFEVAITVAKTLMMLTNASDMVLEILGVTVTTTALDASEQLNVSITTVSNAASAAGTAVTPSKHEQGDVASSVTVIANLSSEPNSYEAVDLDHEGFSSVGGYFYEPIPESRPIVSPSGVIGIRLLDAPDASTIMVVDVTYREIGG